MHPYKKNPHNQIRGAQNRAQGGLFEQIIEASCIHYRECGVAEIEKTPEPFRVTRRISDYQFEGHFEKQAQPDFKGSISEGRTIIFEAKHTESDSIKQNRVTPAQTDALNRYHSMGAKCFVLVSLQFKMFAFVPWNHWIQMKQRFNHLYMTETDLKPYQVPFNGRTILFLKEIT